MLWALSCNIQHALHALGATLWTPSCNIYDGVNSLMLHITRFEHLDVTLLCTTYLYNIHFCVVLPCLYLLKDDQLKQFGTLAQTCKWKTTNIQFCLTLWEPNKTHFHQCNIIKTILKSCKYQPNCKSTQNALDTKHWKGCENQRGHCGRGDLVLFCFSGRWCWHNVRPFPTRLCVEVTGDSNRREREQLKSDSS